MTIKKSRMNFKYFIKEGFGNIFLHGFMSFAAVSIIAACLLITSCVTLIAVNIDIKIKDLQAESEIVVFIDENVPRSAAQALESRLLEIDNIHSAEFLTKEEELDQYREQLDENASLLDGFDDTNNPLRDSYHIRLKNIEQMESTVDEIRQIQEIKNIRVDEDTVSMLVKIRKVFEIVSLVLVAALGGISLFIISNTVKLALFARREEIAIMKMVGATNWFIRWPFIIEGFVIGVMGSIIAFFAQWGIYYKLSDVVSTTIGVFSLVEFRTILTPVLGIIVLAGALIGVLGSALTIRKFLDV
jgi:cell division transport system permease protein